MLISSRREQDIACVFIVAASLPRSLLDEAERFAWTVLLATSATLAYRMRRQVESYRIKQTVFAFFLQPGYFGWSYPDSWSS